jgi:hypothetical protein
MNRESPNLRTFVIFVRFVATPFAIFVLFVALVEFAFAIFVANRRDLRGYAPA